MLKKDVVSNKESNTAKVDRHLKQNFNELSSNLLVIKDSLTNNSLLTIWPKGVFTFSKEFGFTGEAVKVQMATKSQQIKRIDALAGRLTKRQIDVAEKGVLTANISSSESHSFKWKPSYFLIVLLVLAGIGLLLWLLKRK